MLKKTELYGMQLNMEFLKILNFRKALSCHVFLILITFLFILSCKKEKDNNPPQIVVQLPQSGIQLNCIDSVLIQAEVTDDNGPLTVSFYVADAQNNYLTAPVFKTSSESIINLNEIYYFSNKYIETGTYYIVIHAEDGKNVVNTFIEIQINGLALELKSIYVGAEDPSGVRIYNSDASGVFSASYYLQGTFVDFKINNYSQQLYVLSSGGVLSCYHLPNFEKEWEQSGFNNIGSAYKGQLLESDFLIYVTDSDGEIKGFDNSGVLRKVYNLPSGSPEYFNFCNSRLFVYSYNYQNNSKYIYVFSSSTGVLYSYPVDFNVRRFFSYSTNNILVVGEKNNQTSIYTFNFEINYLYPLGNPINDIFKDAVETPDDQYLLSTASEIKVIEKYYGNSNIYALGQKANILLFERTSNHVYLCDSSRIKELNYPNSQAINVYDFPSKILFLDFLYNK